MLAMFTSPVQQPISMNAQAQVPSAIEHQVEIQTQRDSTLTKNSNNKQQVESYFSDIPIMTRIAFCESGNREFDSDGNILRGIENNRDVGIFQINERYHLENALRLDYNLYSVEGNMKYARYLYEKQGTAPWKASKPCWGNR